MPVVRGVLLGRHSLTSRPSWRALPRAVHRPFVLVATGLVLLSASGASVPTGSTADPAPAVLSLDAAAERQVREQAAATDAEAEFHREAQAVSRSERRQALEAERAAAAEAERLAAEEAVRVAEEAAREVEGQEELDVGIVGLNVVGR